MFKTALKFISLSCLSFSFIAPLFSFASVVDYDIVYVRYPATDPDGTWVTVPQGESAYRIAAGADLMLLKNGGPEEAVLVDCDECSVMDPFISYDGKTVYYTLIDEGNVYSASWLYKIDLSDPEFTPIRLTFDDGFDSHLYAANTTELSDQSKYIGIKDMAPVPLADGRLLFTSNRAGLTALRPGTNAVSFGSVQQLYVMDDHDGSANNKSLSNIKRLETGTMHLAQHPIQLADGRILFSTWQDVANKAHYAMTPLFTVNPDGTNLRQFTEPHDHHKMVEHYITQLSNSDVISTQYYPSYDYGFGIFWRQPLIDDGIEFLRDSIPKTEYRSGENLEQLKSSRISYREFDRIGAEILTPHTTPNDVPAPNKSGKYSMPSATRDNGLLMAYSKGYVNHFGAVCNRTNQEYKCDHLKSGIYLLNDAHTAMVETPSQLIKIKDDENYNEIWPRAVLPYKEIYGIDKPKAIQKTNYSKVLIKGAATALVGTSSMYNRETSPGGSNPDRFESGGGRERQEGNWLIQGSDAGVYTNNDIYGVRVVSTPSKPYTSPVLDRTERDKVRPYLEDGRLGKPVARYGSFHNERWEVLGEFPLTNKNVIDQQGNPDSSWAAIVPADTPFLIQAIDDKGMTLNSELTWRGLKPGENRTDCGGCHAHSIEGLDFSTTQTAKYIESGTKLDTGMMKLTNGSNIKALSLRSGIWDLAKNSIPVLASHGDQMVVEFIDGNVLGVEFRRDIKPILDTKCISCHTKEGSGEPLILDGSGGVEPYLVLGDRRKPDGGGYSKPQRSKYIRVPQARQSLLTWVIWGERLDGRTNETRDTDIDYTLAIHSAHKDLKLSDKEKRTVARWIDLGSPIDFPQTDGMGYTDDNQLPIVNLQLQDSEPLAKAYEFTVGVHDVHSGIDWSSVKVAFASADEIRLKGIEVLDVASEDCAVQPMQTNFRKGLLSYSVSKASLLEGNDYVFSFEIKDKTGNKNIATQRFSH